jgi:hypothetical protein
MTKGISQAGNAGVVAVTAAAAGDLLHTLSTGRSARLKKIHCYAPALVTLQLGTRDAAGTFVPLMPLFTAIAGFDNEWGPDDIPDVEWKVLNAAGAAGRNGNIYVVSSVAGATVQISVVEIFHNQHVP